MRTLPRTLACVVGCLIVGAASAAVGRIDGWYDTIAKPAWTPPGWMFGVVWTVLYVTMGLALSSIVAKGSSSAGVRRAVGIFVVQLALNALWSPVFFGLHSPVGGMVVILALWPMVGWTVAAFWSVRDVAGVLLLPYWAWVTFAVALNASLWRMNS